jgi:biopolymer transport protein ExbD
MASADSSSDQSFEDYADAVVASEGVTGSILKKRRREETEMDITPMIDCTFLLLIFFLLTSKMDEGANIKLPPAKYGLPIPAKNAVVLTIDAPQADGPAVVYKGNSNDPALAADSSDLEALEDEIAEYVEEQVSGISRKQYVLIKAAEGVKHRDVARVARAASRVEDVQQLHVAVLEVHQAQ